MEVTRLSYAYLPDSFIFSHGLPSLVRPSKIEVQRDLASTSKEDGSHRNAETHDVFSVLRGTENLADLISERQYFNPGRCIVITYYHASGVSDALVHANRHSSLVVWRMAIEQP
jgi:hypothetical protein